MHTVVLEPGKDFHTHKGSIAHDDLIGASEGVVVRSTGGVDYLALRPLYADFVLSMPRGAAVVYPKDAGQVVTMGDVFPGAFVVEAGVGSGALSCALLRAVGERGTLLSYERRADFAAIARANVEAFFGAAPGGWRLEVGDFSARLPSDVGAGEVDRVVLDMLAPWECLDASAHALAPRRRARRVRRHDDPAVTRGRGPARARLLHRTGRVGVDGARVARGGARRPARAPHGRSHRLPGALAPARRRGDAATAAAQADLCRLGDRLR